MAKHPLPSRLGTMQNYKTRIAANLNFEKRCLMGFIAQTAIHSNILWIKRHHEYETALTVERREQLDVIHKATEDARKAAKKAVEEIEKYYLLPNTPSPRRERQKTQRRAKSAITAAQKLAGD